jgi:glycosyltransferase A (GT-A) superfamily protein (DUF2064 family)
LSVQPLQARSRAVVLFRGDPRREEKQKCLPPRFLSALHEELTRTIRRAPGVELIVASGTGDRFEVRGAQSSRTIEGSSFAEKIDGAVRFAFEAGYESVVLLAGDIVGLTWSVLDDAFARVESKPRSVVVGPSGDGGFYLVAMARSASIDWSQIPWFTANALAGLVRQIVTRKLDCFITPRIDDVDDYAAALRAVRGLRAGVLKNRLQSVLHPLHVLESLADALWSRLVTPLLSPRAPPSLAL